MNHSKINSLLLLHFVSLVMVFESIFMLAAVVLSYVYHETIAGKMLLAFASTLLSGGTINILTYRQRHHEPNIRESFIIVSLGWIVMGLVGTIPYLLTRSIPAFTNAFFESFSGFTTTGSSILSDIEALPKSILFWRAETHWIGGMGIIVLVIAIMPFLKIDGIYLFYSEASSIDNDKISTRITTVARKLWLIYLGLTGIEIVLLVVGGMPLFDSVCHAFATVATGGFSTKNDSIAGYSPYIQYVITVFMLLSGTNFAIHFLMLKHRFKEAVANEEFRWYLRVVCVIGAMLTCILFFHHPELNFEHAFRIAFFQVVSVITATGFATADYLQWTQPAIGLIVVLMLIGASAGSTGGGIKVIRYVLLFKRMKQSFSEILFPKRVTIIRYNKRGVKTDFLRQVLTYIFVYYMILAVSTLVMMLWTSDLATSFGAVATCMAGIGPGFGTVGPVSNFLHLPSGAKYFLTFIMLIGRLEVYTVLVVFSRTFWRD